MTGEPVVVDRTMTDRGELVLRQVGETYEVISNGVFLMDTRNGESERLLVEAALAAHGQAAEVLIGGLGVGFSAATALADEGVERLVIIEIEPKVIEWNRTHLAAANAAALADHRTEVVREDLLDYLRRSNHSFDVICLDIDNGPDWTVTDRNRDLYDDAGTALITSRLPTDGVCAIWSAARSPSYEAVLAAHFERIDVHDVPVARGGPDVVMVASRPR